MRVATEEYALDSYQNLLFAIARFREVTGNWPGKITVVGYGMKRRRYVSWLILLESADGRFELLHARAIGWPEDRFEYLGIDDDGDTTQHYAGEVSPSLLTGSILTRAAQIRFHTLPILSIRLSPTTLNKETIPKSILALSPLSH
jgi:hypothetical protein